MRRDDLSSDAAGADAPIRDIGLVAKRLAGWAYDRRLLAIALIALVMVVFVPHGERIARAIGLVLVLPLAGLGLVVPGWRHGLAFSVVLLACGAYLCALLASSVAGDAAWPLLSRQLIPSIAIPVFLAITGSLLVAFPGFPRWLFLGAGTAAAIITGINIYLFFEHLQPANYPALSDVRLVATLGMPGYTNSTNISATCAVMFAGTVAAALGSGARPWQRTLLLADAGVFLAAIVLTQARSAALAVLAVLLVLALTAPRRFRYPALAGLAACCLLPLAIPLVMETVLARGASLRPEVWSAFLRLIAEKPWIGYGPFSSVTITVGDGYVLDQAHNLVLSAWFRGGVAGAVAMTCILGAGTWWSLRYWRSTGDRLPLCVTAAVLTAGMLDYQLLATYPTWPWPTFWLPFGLAAGAEMACRKRSRRPQEAIAGGVPHRRRD